MPSVHVAREGFEGSLTMLLGVFDGGVLTSWYSNR